MRNHNGLIGRYPGADGMKTGFICASGFNVVASATRNGRRLITVVMGSTSANERTLKAAELFDLGFERTAFMNPTLDKLPASAVAEPPNMRPVICDRRGPMPGEDDTGGLSASTEAGSFSAPNLMAYASAPVNRTVLGPRGPVQPVRVWLGPNPPSEAELTAQAQAEEAEEQARLANRKGRKGKAVAAKPEDPAVPAAVALKPAEPKPVEAKPAAPASTPKVVNLKPEVTPAAKPKIINVKPETIPAAAPKPAATATGRASLAVKPVHADDKPKPALKIMDGPETKAIDTKKPAPAKPAAAKPATAEKPAPKVEPKAAEKPAAKPEAKTAETPASKPEAKAAEKPAPKPAVEAKPAAAKPAAKSAAEAKPKTASKEAPKT
jgi:D-alanyl-D-alanine carboxypeptidase